MKKVLIYAGLAALLVAGEDGFDLAPTPVSQTQVKNGESEGMTRLTYISSTVSANGRDFDITGGGAQAAKKSGEEGGATNLSGSVLVLSGSGESLDATAVNANVAYLWEKYHQTAEGAPYTIFYGIDFSYLYMNMYSSVFETDLYTKLYGGTLGIQYNIHSADMIISPFGVAKYLMGDYEANTWVGDNYNYASGDLDPMLTRAFGFDIYFKSVGSTLSAMIKNDSASSTTMLSYSWNW